MLAHPNAFSWRNLRRLVAGGLRRRGAGRLRRRRRHAGTILAPRHGADDTAGHGARWSTSSTTIASSGADGTEVTLTAIVKDANNNALPGATVSFKADSGTISNTTRTTDANGTVAEKLSVKGDPTARAITITAIAGARDSAPGGHRDGPRLVRRSCC